MNASLTTGEIIWVAVGFIGQALFSMRFIIQWITSEIRGPFKGDPGAGTW